MQNKPYKIQENTSMTVNEPAVSYQRTHVESSFSGTWNPNVSFHGTQEEWREHFRHIEEGKFTSLEEANKEFEAWKKEYLANRLK